MSVKSLEFADDWKLAKVFPVLIGVREIFCRGGGGAVNHLPKKISQVAQILRKSRKEMRAILH